MIRQVPSKLAEILPVRWEPGEESRIRAKVTQHGMDSSVFDPLMTEGFDPLGTLPSLAIGSTPKHRAGLPQVLMQSSAGDSDADVPVVTNRSVMAKPLSSRTAPARAP